MFLKRERDLFFKIWNSAFRLLTRHLLNIISLLHKPKSLSSSHSLPLSLSLDSDFSQSLRFHSFFHQISSMRPRFRDSHSKTLSHPKSIDFFGSTVLGFAFLHLCWIRYIQQLNFHW